MSEAKLTKVIVTVRSTRKTKETKIPRDKSIESKLIGKYDKEKEIRQRESARKQATQTNTKKMRHKRPNETEQESSGEANCMTKFEEL